MPVPCVSVVMPVFNGGSYLRAAIESILSQTLRDLEFVVVDDGSTDETPRILEEIALRDARVRVISQANAGVTVALNRGLDAARGEFIARMDADDISLPNRLRAQVDLLRRRPRVGIVGTWVQKIDARDRPTLQWRTGQVDLVIRWQSLLEVAFVHPTIMVRRAVLDDHGLRYDPEIRYAQDYALYARVLEHVEGANIPELLHLLRRHDKSVGAIWLKAQRETHRAIAWKSVTRSFPDLGFTLDEIGEVLAVVPGLSLVPSPAQSPDVAAAIHRYLDLWEAFAARYGAHPDLSLAAHHTAQRLARYWVGKPRHAGQAEVMARLFRLAPGGCLRVLASFAKRGVRSGLTRSVRRVQRNSESP